MQNYKKSPAAFVRRAVLLLILAVGALSATAASPTETRFSAAQCQGSAMPYVAPAPDAEALLAVPDTLEPVMVNHVGRHGARFPSSAKNVKLLDEALDRAAEQGTITPTGRKLQALIGRINTAVAGRWGALDSLGASEQRGIAGRMVRRYPQLFASEGEAHVTALASYSPRCIMSMYEFCHQLSRLNNRLEINTSSGRRNSRLMRPFDEDADYAEYRNSRAWETPLDELERTSLPLEPLMRALGQAFEIGEDEARPLAMAMFSVVSSTSAAGLPEEIANYYKPAEWNATWAVSNLRHYLQYSASTLSLAPAEMASWLLLDLIDTTDAATQGTPADAARLRFGHAETLMPLLALMRLQGCYYMTNYFDTVASHWRDFDIVPMAANLQLVLFRSKASGQYYVRVDLNEHPVPLIPGRDALYTPWTTAKDYLIRCLPFVMQP